MHILYIYERKSLSSCIALFFTIVLTFVGIYYNTNWIGLSCMQYIHRTWRTVPLVL